MVSIVTTNRAPSDLQGISMTLLDAEARQQAHSSQGNFLANLAVGNKSTIAASSDLPTYASQPSP